MKKYYYKLKIFDVDLFNKKTENTDGRWPYEKICYVFSKTGVFFHNLDGHLFYTEDNHDIECINDILDEYGMRLTKLYYTPFFIKEEIEPKIKELIDLSIETNNDELSAYFSSLLDNIKIDFRVK